MSIGIWKIIYEPISIEAIDYDDLDFAYDHFWNEENHEFYISSSILDEVVEEISNEEMEAHHDLIMALRRELDKDDGFAFDMG